MKVLALASYPVEAAATRYRLYQFVEPLAARGITLTIRPFLDSASFERIYRPREIIQTALGLSFSSLRRLGDVFRAREADVLLVQREAMTLGPPVVEWMANKVFRCPMVLDLDDATYISYTSPTYGRLGKTLKWFGKTDDLIRWSRVVTCGNRVIADYVAGKGTRARIIPTVVDTDVFRPATAERDGSPVILGWVGTHSTYPFLKSIFPVLQKLAADYAFRLKVVGAGTDDIRIPGVQVENLQWSLRRETSDFQSFDIGLYPIDAASYGNDWTMGKSCFKAIQYMAVGVPYVVSPVGVCAEIGEAGVTHLAAASPDEWYEALRTLLQDREQRQRMGSAGRQYALKHYNVSDQADKLAQALREAVN
jgi:glycosyltransferase involved in cell wall biosynthesis